MSEWKRIDSAPRDKVILLYGQFDPHPDDRQLYSRPDINVIATGGWDEIDEAWSLTGSTWTGPWIKATHWMPLPSPPLPNPPEDSQHTRGRR